jgi:general secretion pathway protein D
MLDRLMLTRITRHRRPSPWLVALVLAAGPLLASPAHAEAPAHLDTAPTVDGDPGASPGPALPSADSEDGGGGGGGGATATRGTRASGRTTRGSDAEKAAEGGDDAGDDGGDEASDGAAAPKPRQKAPVLSGKARKVTINFVDAPLSDVVKYMAEITGRNFILNDDLKGEVTIISHQAVSVPEAYEAFLSAMEMEGFTTVTVGKATKVVSTGVAANNPLRVYQGGDIPYTDNYVTQIIQFENVQVSEISSVVKDLSGKGAKIIAYAPTNTLIITDAAVNIRRVYRIISQLDVASPKAKMELIPLSNATAAEIQRIIEQLYGSEESGSTSAASNRRSSRTRDRGTATRSNRKGSKTSAAAGASASSVGKEGKYIQKIISDERTNSLLVLANAEAMQAVKDLVAKLDVDVDPQSRAQIHVRYLEHAKSEDVAQVLSQLSQGGSSSSSSRNSATRNRRGAATTSRNGRTTGPTPRGPLGADAGEGGTSAVAAFDSGLRITSDENTNSLVIIATRDQYAIIEKVIDQLDIPRKQVFVEAVILELSASDEFDVGLGVHLGKEQDLSSVVDSNEKGIGFGSVQMNGSSTGFSTDLLSGLAVGVYGPSIDVPLAGGEAFSIPAFGIVLNALQSNGAVNIVSTPNLLTMDNEEAKIVVGRNVPFPVGTGRDNNNNPIISFQREDVAITLKVTPQINESNYVTLQVFQEVQEIETDTSNLDPLTSGGPTTSKRSVESTVVVKDNQTIVLGGLIGETDSEVETKVPILGDLPLVGRLFRGRQVTRRKTNLLIFLTPHIISEPADLEEVYRVKVAQRQEFMRRFYGKSRDAQEAEMRNLLSYSMNQIDRPSRYRGPAMDGGKFNVIGGEVDDSGLQDAAQDALQDAAGDLPGADGVNTSNLPTGD